MEILDLITILGWHIDIQGEIWNNHKTIRVYLKNRGGQEIVLLRSGLIGGLYGYSNEGNLDEALQILANRASQCSLGVENKEQPDPLAIKTTVLLPRMQFTHSAS